LNWGGAERHPKKRDLAADPHTMVVTPLRTAALMTATSITLAAIIAPVVTITAITAITAVITVSTASTITGAVLPISAVTLLIGAMIRPAVVLLRIGARGGTERCRHQSGCCDDLGDLHLSSFNPEIGYEHALRWRSVIVPEQVCRAACMFSLLHSNRAFCPRKHAGA
jgi:hypothetical protein